MGSDSTSVRNQAREVLWRRYLLYLSTLSTGASAAHDLRPAVAALTQTAHQPGSDDARQQPRDQGLGMREPYDPRPAALLSIYYRQAAPVPPAASRAVESGRECKPKPGWQAPAAPPLPANVAVCGPPDGHIGCAAAVADAERLFMRLFPELPGLVAALGSSAGAGMNPNPGGEDSDDEALDALSSALRGLGEGPASER